MLMILLSKCDQASDLWQQLELASLNMNLIYETLWTGAKSGLLISMLGFAGWLSMLGFV